MLMASTTDSASGQLPLLSLLKSRLPFVPVTSKAPGRPGPEGLPSTTTLGKASSIASARAINLYVGVLGAGGRGRMWAGGERGGPASQLIQGNFLIDPAGAMDPGGRGGVMEGEGGRVR